MARRLTTQTGEEQSADREADLAASVARLSEATTLLLKVAERLEQRIEERSTSTEVPSAAPKPKRMRRKNVEEPPSPTEAETVQTINAALGGITDISGEGDISRIQMNAPSNEVFERFFGKVLALYEINRKRQAEERDKRFRSEKREEALQEIQATIETVFSSPLITNAEKNEALRILIKEIVPYEDRIEITYR